MADSRFYDNRGPISLEVMCAAIGVHIPAKVDKSAKIFDVASLTTAGPQHLSLFDGGFRARTDFASTRAGWCFVSEVLREATPQNSVLLICPSAPAAFAAAAQLFYRNNEFGFAEQAVNIHPSARLAEGVIVGLGAFIAEGVEIGARTRVGANAIIGRGVSIGRDSEIGPNAWIGFSYLGDEVVIGPGARIGGPGFGFVSSAAGHMKIPQLGRVIVRDRVEIGANSTVDRGALTDTMIGEGTKIDNLVQIGHNTIIGRHCMIVACVGISGSVILGDHIVLGGKVGVADHVSIGDGARVAAAAGVAKDLPGGGDYGGVPARPIKSWHRETAILKKLAQQRAVKRPS